MRGGEQSPKQKSPELWCVVVLIAALVALYEQSLFIVSEYLYLTCMFVWMLRLDVLLWPNSEERGQQRTKLLYGANVRLQLCNFLRS